MHCRQKVTCHFSAHQHPLPHPHLPQVHSNKINNNLLSKCEWTVLSMLLIQDQPFFLLKICNFIFLLLYHEIADCSFPSVHTLRPADISAVYALGIPLSHRQAAQYQIIQNPSALFNFFNPQLIHMSAFIYRHEASRVVNRVAGKSINW